MTYIRHSPSLLRLEYLLFEPGIDICHETVRYRCNRFGPMFTAAIRKRRIHHRWFSHWRWHLDEVFVSINRETHYLWHAVDHKGEVLEVFATKRRDREGCMEVPEAHDEALRPTAIDGNRPASVVPTGNAADQECGRWLNNRAEISYQPFRRREAAKAKFRDAKTLQKFSAAHASIHNHFNQDRHLNRRDYDPVAVGFVTDPHPLGFEFRAADMQATPIPGNANTGHSGKLYTQTRGTYGEWREFTKDERWALVEFMKTLH